MVMVERVECVEWWVDLAECVEFAFIVIVLRTFELIIFHLGLSSFCSRDEIIARTSIFFVEGILSYLPKYTFYCNRCIVPFFSLYRHQMSFMLMSLLFHASYSLLFIHKPYSIDHRDKMLTKRRRMRFFVNAKEYMMASIQYVHWINVDLISLK